MPPVKSMRICALLLICALSHSTADEKKIGLEDIEQDNLKSEQAKDEETEQRGYAPQRNPHQYDVEENNVQDTPAIIYAPTGHQHVQEGGQQQYDYQSNSIEQPQMQIIYLQPVDNGHGYQGHALYYQTAPSGGGDVETNSKDIGYVTVPVVAPVPHHQYVQYQEQQNLAARHPLHNYASYVNQQQYQYVQSHERTPKVLPQYAQEVSRPIYSHISGNLASDHQQVSYKQPIHHHRYTDSVPDPYKLGYGQFTKRRPNSLLESYIPSSLQIEYLKRGLSREPLSTYDTIAHTQGFPVKNFESGFVPNHVYATAGGGVKFGHFKRHVKRKGN